MASPYEMPILPEMPFAHSLGAADEGEREKRGSSFALMREREKKM